MATPHDEDTPASGGGAIPAESARPQSGGGDGAPQQALQQPSPADGEGEGAPTIATAPIPPTVDSPALRAAVAAVAEPPHQNHLKITHEDYDWMGVLDTLEAHPDGCWGGACHDPPCSSPRSGPAGHGPGHALPPPHPQGTAEAQAASLAASVAAIATEAIANNGAEAGKLSAAASNAPVESDAGGPATSGNGSNTEAKKQSRIEKKRHREKQRRLDTNTQFEALAEMVREIEAVDFAEEARYNLSGGAGSLGKANLNAHAHGAAVPGAPAPPTLEGKSPEESPAEPKKRKAGDEPLGLPPPPTAAFHPSNRVDLIARTISQLSRFRALRRRRHDELVEARRRECQLRKEADELRRTVAHYKAVGLGGMYPQKPPEKVMMMVPMMVPQDAVGRIAAGYPAAHQYASASYGLAPHPMGNVPHQQPAYGLGVAAHPSHPPAGAAPSMAAAAPPAHLQPYSGHPPAAAPTAVQLTPGAGALGDGSALSAGESAMASQPQPPYGAHDPPPAPSYASAAPHHLAGTHAPPHAAAPPTAMAMYPHPPSVPGGMPTVAFGRHPHPPAAQPMAPAGPPPGTHAPAPPHGAANPAGVQPALPPRMHPPQQLQQPTPPTGAMPQQLAADKPPAPPAGGGGNLAHCA
ncbi:hypothetical protein ACHAXT_006521 [Thalassiosira profunda]